MMRRYVLPIVVIFILAVFLALGFFIVSVRAQNEIVSSLTERLVDQNVPVKSIHVQRQFPFEIEITISSIGESDDAISTNIWNMYLAERESMLSELYGIDLYSYTVQLVDDNGEILSWRQYFPDEDKRPFPSGSSKINNDDTAKIVVEKLDLYGMTLNNFEITTNLGKNGNIQFLKLVLSVEDIETANRIFPHFFSSLQSSIETINKSEGTRIAVCDIDIFTKDNSRIMRYILDLEMTRHLWWSADDITATWYPQPAPDTEDKPTSFPQGTPYPLPSIDENTTNKNTVTPYP